MPKSTISGLYSKYILSFYNKLKRFFRGLYYFPFLPAMYEKCSFFAFLPAFSVIIMFYFGYFHRYVVLLSGFL